MALCDIRHVPGGMCAHDRHRTKFLQGKPQKRVLLDVSVDVFTPFCLAGVALCDYGRVPGGMWVHDRR